MLRLPLAFIVMTLGSFVSPMSLFAQPDLPPWNENPSLWIPLPNLDPSPKGDQSDFVWKISDKAACEKAGGVWVQRGNTGFCYLKIEAEPVPDPKPIPDEGGGEPSWNDGSDLDPIKASVESVENDPYGFIWTDPMWMPLPNLDPSPKGDSSDFVWKISDKAACEKAGGVWVQRGNTGFCYLKIEAEPVPDPKPIPDEGGGEPSWNDGSDRQPIKETIGK